MGIRPLCSGFEQGFDAARRGGINSRSEPAAKASTAASPAPHCPAIASITRASVHHKPSELEVLAQQLIDTALKGWRTLGIQCPAVAGGRVITLGDPAAIGLAEGAAAPGPQAGSRSGRKRQLQVWNAAGVAVAGKCLAQASTPSAWVPRESGRQALRRCLDLPPRPARDGTGVPGVV